MSKYSVVFSVKGGIRTFTEVVEASSVEQVRVDIWNLVISHGLVLKQILSIVEL